jgi:hypothetical protein
MAIKEDKELQEFRNLMTAPDEYEDGFGWRTIFMAFFVGLLMVPAQMYMSLVAGMDLGGAARWVTVILYVEVSRRAFVRLRRPEIFVLFYMCGAIMSSGRFGTGLIWHQFLAQSEEIRKMGITEYIPTWFAPTNPDVLGQRNFFMKEWMAPLGLMILGMLMSRVNHFGLGYVLFRLTSDVERLPFPMAPVGAMGMTALADASSERETWRWRTFCIGGVAGLAFGAVYLAVPNITSAVFSQSLRLIPLPFVDLTGYSEHYLPAMPVLISFDLGLVVTGMVLPFWAMVGSFIGLLFTIVVNPVLFHAGILRSWEKGIGGIQTIQSNTMDFYFSFGLGLSLAVALIGFIHVFRSFVAKKKQMDDAERPDVKWQRLFKPPAGRGDVPIWVGLATYIFSTLVYIVLTYYLVNYCSGELLGSKFPLALLIFYGFVYTPVVSYVSTRMEGIVGQQVAIPFVREATFIFSGYKGAAIWFAPIPMHDYSRQALFFKTTELTGTRFTSLLKAEILIFPIVMVGAVLFGQFIWSIDNVPSELFPYANEFWELRAFQQGLVMSATLPGEATTPFQEALKPEYLVGGVSLALIVYFLLSHFGLPIFLVYGVVRGLDQSVPHAIIPMFIGALLGRFVLRRRFGPKWPQYRIVFAAGFSAGVGLVTMLSLGVVFMTKSVIKLPV